VNAAFSTAPARAHAWQVAAALGLALGGWLPAPQAQAQAQPFPLTVQSCGQPLRFDAPPKRAVFHDKNMLAMALALQLQPQMVGVTGLTGWYGVGPQLQRALGDVPELAPRAASLETLLAARPDFFFAGWSYGMHPGGPVTPDTLAREGVKTLVLSESCIRVDKSRPTASMALLYDDFIKLGAIFGKREQAQGLVNSWKKRVADLPPPPAGEPVRVFLYDSGEGSPTTGGRHAMPEALITAAGGRNIMDDLATSWTRTSWEIVATRNPELILMLGSQGDPDAARLKNYLRTHPVMRRLEAVKSERFLVLRYEEVTPSPANIDAIEKINAAIRATRVPATRASSANVPAAHAQ